MNPSTASDRSRPRIHDHETLKLIGRGAYGEVWLAKSVTGVMRAVKVVWRSDYDYVEAFEREFEAIKKYEPVSRRHAGLVPVLQVGRNDEEGFYYYVMELADDVEEGREIKAETYRPLTLTALLRKEGRVKSAACLKIGETVAEGLHFMHGQGLIHRDVKPSNLVFIDGVCRLADIGLVALLGQRSFVGTEGFVAPEGPGTAQSDVFSLGMVLYEASTGKDRLDFPDLPSARESGTGLEQWRLLHRVICRACAQRSTERFSSAGDMALALRGERVRDGASLRKWKMAMIGLAAVLAVGLGIWMNAGERITTAMHRTQPLLTIQSLPTGVEVYSNGLKLGVTPLGLNPLEGVAAIYQMRMSGYRMQEIEFTANKKQPATYEVKMEESKLPQPGERWMNSLGMSFLPRQNGHASERPVEMRFFDGFLKASGRTFEGRVVPYVIRGEKNAAYIVVVPSADAEAFRSWLTDADREKGLLATEHHYELETLPFVEGVSTEMRGPESPPPADADDEPTDWQAFSLRVERQGYGGVLVQSNPPGVSVFQSGELLGLTPLEISRVKTGPVEFELRGDGYTDLILEGTLVENEMLELFGDMDVRRSVTFGREWRNSMGLRFLPLGEVLMGATETRRRDYMEFAKETNVRRPTQIANQPKQAQFPVAGVSREEAVRYCEWLTKRERELGLIGVADRYRLPTDEEWSRAVGLPLERGKDPAERNGRIRGVYPWGYEWPPPRMVDNFADESYGRRMGGEEFIAGYDDRQPGPSGVAAMPPGAKGFLGLAGNVSEWVSNDFGGSSALKSEEGSKDGKKPVMGTVRGGNWRTVNADELLSSARIGMMENARSDTVGFRMVLAKGGER
ncbi:PEGA domain-containing protein [Phragmitibacter flavus]|uniref:PEGA domain-containing protein n=1 Tax=Phragmitibacter flavus TaxID=2576071 RepID=A0A5R8KC28_9BACT|nr:bifunctional serine/threonine-protein kinase/formylglycine-generating enzyme family protein [Phragmitibacter flavus]TLD69874.1 PEGA domain-containing protein [Phragmitibacter flavus]